MLKLLKRAMSIRFSSKPDAKFDVLTFKFDSFTQHHKSFLKCVALVHLFLLEQLFVDLTVLDYIGCWYVSFLSKPTLNLFIAAKQNCQSP